jgi:hypothetical protein
VLHAKVLLAVPFNGSVSGFQSDTSSRSSWNNSSFTSPLSPISLFVPESRRLRWLQPMQLPNKFAAYPKFCSTAPNPLSTSNSRARVDLNALCDPSSRKGNDLEIPPSSMLQYCFGLLTDQPAIEPTERIESCDAGHCSSDEDRAQLALLSFSQSLLRRRF